MKKLGELALWLLIFGGIVLGYKAASGTNLIAVLANGNSSLEKILLGAIGVSALIVLGGKIKK